MIKIQDRLWQWDTDLYIEVESLCEVHFAAVGSSEALIVESKMADGRYIAAIPNILLQECRDFFVFIMNGNDTLESKRVSVIARPKPDDYIYTETEIKDYEELEERISALEDEGSYELPIASASTLGGIKVGTNLTITSDGVLEAPYSAKGDKGDKGDSGEAGQDGYTPQRGVDYWTSADIAEIHEYIDEAIPEADSYTLPVASSTTLGGVKIGANLTISSDGVLSANASSASGGASAEKQFETLLLKISGYGGWGVLNQDANGNPLNAEKVVIGMSSTAQGVAYLRIQAMLTLSNGSSETFIIDTDPKAAAVYIDVNNGKAYAIATKIGTGAANNGYKGDATLVFSNSCRQPYTVTGIKQINFDFYDSDGAKVDPTFTFGNIVGGNVYMLFSGVLKQ